MSASPDADMLSLMVRFCIDVKGCMLHSMARPISSSTVPMASMKVPVTCSHSAKHLSNAGSIQKVRQLTVIHTFFALCFSFWPAIIVQRCLVHVQRQGLSWCRQHPKRSDARQLRRIFLMVLQIRSQDQRRHFQRVFGRWNDRYGSQLSQITARAWVSNDLQRARSMLINALPFMFGYLDDANIPRSTNALEGYFSRLKLRYRQHRGLSKRHRLSYFQWYFRLCPR